MTTLEKICNEVIEEANAIKAEDTIENIQDTVDNIERYMGIAFPNADRMARALLVMREALEWVLHPKHDEPDDYTRLACSQHRANEALERAEQIMRGEE